MFCHCGKLTLVALMAKIDGTSRLPARGAAGCLNSTSFRQGHEGALCGVGGGGMGGVGERPNALRLVVEDAEQVSRQKPLHHYGNRNSDCKLTRS